MERAEEIVKEATEAEVTGEAAVRAAATVPRGRSTNRPESRW